MIVRSPPPDLHALVLEGLDARRDAVLVARLVRVLLNRLGRVLLQALLLAPRELGERGLRAWCSTS